MPILSHLDFVKHGLSVSYRASEEPQDVMVEVTTADESPLPLAGGVLHKLVDAINRGSASGRSFHPTVSAASILDELSDRGPHYRWRLRLVAVDPLFLRTIVEELRLSSGGPPVVSMRITGSLPLDDTELSVHEDTVRAWLDEPRAYLGEWPEPGFRIIDQGSWAAWRVQLSVPITQPVRWALDWVAIGWFNDIWTYVGDTGKPEAGRLDQCLPHCSSSDKEYCAAYRRFHFARGPARARLVNALIRFHHTVSAIENAEISP